MQPIYEHCGCGSGNEFKLCCNQKSAEEILRDSSKFPIYECLISERWQVTGLASLLVSRKISDDLFLLGSYLVDLYCLGLKDTLALSRIDTEDYLITRHFFTSRHEVIDVDYEDARSIVLGAIDYAHSLGFRPQHDWIDSQFVIEAVRSYEEKFEFGVDGIPCYIEGPNDDRITIIETLSARDSDFAVAAPWTRQERQ